MSDDIEVPISTGIRVALQVALPRSGTTRFVARRTGEAREVSVERTESLPENEIDVVKKMKLGIIVLILICGGVSSTARWTS